MIPYPLNIVPLFVAKVEKKIPLKEECHLEVIVALKNRITNCCAKNLNHQLLGKTHITLCYPD